MKQTYDTCTTSRKSGTNLKINSTFKIKVIFSKMSPNLKLFFVLFLGPFEAESLTLIKKNWFIDFSSLQGPGRSPAQIGGAHFEQL